MTPIESFCHRATVCEGAEPGAFEGQMKPLAGKALTFRQEFIKNTC